MRHIRPHQLFTLFEAPPGERIVQTMLPNRPAFGGLTLLETFILLAACRIVQAERVFEFGTFRGSTTLNLALNVPASGAVYTLDLDPAEAKSVVQDKSDAPFTEIYLHSKERLDFLHTSAATRIHTLSGNSCTFEFEPWVESMDLVFIDGGHDLATAALDTRNAFRLARKDKAACIVWHDYRNCDYPDLNTFLEDLSGKEEILHIEDTMLCVWFNAWLGLKQR